MTGRERGDDLAALDDQGDLDALTRQVDALCERRAWADLARLRDLCRAALARGRQLWPVASHVEYRLALEAPGPWAGPVLVPGAGHFAPGPLSEVAAAAHAWAELAPHAPPGPVAALAAHERVVRGEDLTGDERAGDDGLDLPWRLEAWEPAYPVATYRAEGGDFPAPPAPTLPAPEEAEPGETVDDPEACRALLDLAAAWVTESNGRAAAVAVTGDASAAVAALGPRHVRRAEVTGADALALMAWAGASGGAHGRRRGMAPGRFAAWWAVVSLAGRLDDWPLPPDEVGAALTRLRWYRWDAGEPETGWVLRLAVEDVERGRAWAVAATDAD